MSAENVELVLGLFPAPDLDLAQLLRDENRWTVWTEANAPFVHPEADTAWPGLPDGKTYTGPVGFKGSVAGVAGSLKDISSGDRGRHRPRRAAQGRDALASRERGSPAQGVAAPSVGHGRVSLKHKAASSATRPEDAVFVTSSGKPRDRYNLRQRVVAPVVARANEMIAERDGEPLPLGISPHKLRHTFASLLVAVEGDPAFVMAQLGHTDPAFTLRVYAHVMRRDPGERERLRALVEGHELGIEWAPLGTGGALGNLPTRRGPHR